MAGDRGNVGHSGTPPGDELSPGAGDRASTCSEHAAGRVGQWRCGLRGTYLRWTRDDHDAVGQGEPERGRGAMPAVMSCQPVLAIALSPALSSAREMQGLVLSDAAKLPTVNP
jgi:hypothetical protein